MEPGPTVWRDATVSLREVTGDTVRQICALKVSPAQERFVAPNALSIAQAYFARDRAWFRAVCAGDTLVGFVMLSDEPEKPEYYLWRFMIDHRYQRNGFGRRAIQQLIDHVRTRPNASELLTSAVPGEGSPIPFYEGLGFVLTGQVDEGEHVLRRPL